MYRQRLGDAVREARMNLELSQNTLAERSHVSLRTISDIETYKANPRFDSLCSLASYLNISIDAVIKDRKNNSGSTTMQQILIELESCSEEEQVIVLQTHKTEPFAVPEELEIFRVEKYGDTLVHFLRYKAA